MSEQTITESREQSTTEQTKDPQSADQTPPASLLRFKQFYSPHELERERIRRELAEPYRLSELQSVEARRQRNGGR